MKLTHELITLHLREPFVSSKGSVSTIRQILVRLNWEGLVGLGTAIFGKEYGMLPDTVAAALDSYAARIERASPYEWERTLRELEATVPNQSSAIAAVDMAVHDLIGQAADLSLRLLLGLDGLPLPSTGLSLGVLPEVLLLERARAHNQWPILKLKLTPASDISVVGRLRTVYPGRIWVDGNGSWDGDQAIAVAKTLHAFDVELLEQPVPAGNLAMLRFVSEHSPVPIFADEDCMGPQDVWHLQGCVQGINIKLLKCGGLRRALEMIQMARRMDLRVMLGCKTESVLGISAMAQIGGLADCLDLDGHLDLIDDPCVGIQVSRGCITLPTGAGLGVQLRDAGAG